MFLQNTNSLYLGESHQSKSKAEDLKERLRNSADKLDIIATVDAKVKVGTKTDSILPDFNFYSSCLNEPGRAHIAI